LEVRRTRPEKKAKGYCECRFDRETETDLSENVKLIYRIKNSDFSEIFSGPLKTNKKYTLPMLCWGNVGKKVSFWGKQTIKVQEMFFFGVNRDNVKQ